MTLVPTDISQPQLSEKFAHFYDIFVRNSFGSYIDILREISYSPLMAEQLSYLKSKSHAHVYSMRTKPISRADENFAREIMQLFSSGLIKLNGDGTPVSDTESGKPLETYTNEDIESLARAWTGFDKSAARGNIEGGRSSQSDIDPTKIVPDWRDPFPKTNLDLGYIGDRYLLCKDLSKSFLMKGTLYRLLGGYSAPELMRDPNELADAVHDILRVELDPSSQLYKRLYNEGNFEHSVELEDDLDCTTGTVECDVDTLRLRVVKVGSLYYEFVERPCVETAFYENGKKIQLRNIWKKRGQMCADPNLAHAREACCQPNTLGEGGKATMEAGVTYLYDGERMTWSTAKDRCVAYGKDLCVFRSVSASPTDDDFRKGYHWTNQACTLSVKVNREGFVAIVHNVDSTNLHECILYLMAQ